MKVEIVSDCDYVVKRARTYATQAGYMRTNAACVPVCEIHAITMHTPLPASQTTTTVSERAVLVVVCCDLRRQASGTKGVCVRSRQAAVNSRCAVC